MEYQPKYASVAQWALAIKSTAKTHTGQRRAIIASFTTIAGYDPRPNERGDAKAYVARTIRQRQETFAANHPLTLSWPPPATREDLEGPGTHPQSAPIGILALQAKHTSKRYARLGEWYVRTSEIEHYDYEYYAKSYGHPRHTVSDRTVHIRRLLPDGALEKRDQPVEAWRGNYLLDALIAAQICEPHQNLMALRLRRAYDLNLVRTGRMIKVYERALGGQHIDFVAAHRQHSYHAASKIDAVRGLRQKINSAVRRINDAQTITYSLGKQLNFCDPGIRACCAAFGLDVEDELTASELHDIVSADPEAAAPFNTELRMLAKAVGYQIAA